MQVEHTNKIPNTNRKHMQSSQRAFRFHRFLSNLSRTFTCSKSTNFSIFKFSLVIPTEELFSMPIFVVLKFNIAYLLHRRLLKAEL